MFTRLVTDERTDKLRALCLWQSLKLTPPNEDKPVLDLWLESLDKNYYELLKLRQCQNAP